MSLGTVQPTKPAGHSNLKPATYSETKLPAYLGFFQLVYDARCRGKALLGALVAGFVA